MKKLHKFLLYFIVFFTVNLLGSLLSKNELNLIAAFSVAIGVSGGIVYFSPFLLKKFNKTV